MDDQIHPKDTECKRRKHNSFQNPEFVQNQVYFDLGQKGFAYKVVIVDADGKIIDIEGLLKGIADALKK